MKKKYVKKKSSLYRKHRPYRYYLSKCHTHRFFPLIYFLAKFHCNIIVIKGGGPSAAAAAALVLHCPLRFLRCRRRLAATAAATLPPPQCRCRHAATTAALPPPLRCCLRQTAAAALPAATLPLRYPPRFLRSQHLPVPKLPPSPSSPPRPPLRCCAAATAAAALPLPPSYCHWVYAAANAARLPLRLPRLPLCCRTATSSTTTASARCRRCTAVAAKLPLRCLHGAATATKLPLLLPPLCHHCQAAAAAAALPLLPPPPCCHRHQAAAIAAALPLPPPRPHCRQAAAAAA
jgi:hypothetical protein